LRTRKRVKKVGKEGGRQGGRGLILRAFRRVLVPRELRREGRKRVVRALRVFWSLYVWRREGGKEGGRGRREGSD